MARSTAAVALAAMLAIQSETVSAQAVFVRWGHKECPAASSTKLYDGFIAGPPGKAGSGANNLCMHPIPQNPDVYDDRGDNTNNALLYGTEYELKSTNVPSAAANNKDAACAVCELNDFGEPYVQWGRSTSCSNGHEKLYTGYVMAQHYEHKRNTWLCVDPAFQAHSTSSDADLGKEDSNQLYAAEMRPGANDEAKYPTNREVGCSVCIAPRSVYSKWGGSSCEDGSTALYTGLVAGSKFSSKGGGVQALCLHDSPQNPPKYTDSLERGALLFGTEYQTDYGNSDFLSNMKAKADEDAGCIVCMLDEPGYVYTAWGRSHSCHGSHHKLYSGVVLSAHRNHQRQSWDCVSTQFATHATSTKGNNDGYMWYPAETENGSIDPALYQSDREIGCTVCASPHAVYVGWGKSKCGPSAREVYKGFVVGGRHNHAGAGYDSLCLTNHPELPTGFQTRNTEAAKMYGTEYKNGDVPWSKVNYDAGCVVCELTTTGSVYTQWGRSQSCSNDDTLYKGTIMAGKQGANGRSQFVCVSTEMYAHPRVAAVSQTSSDQSSQFWYPTEMRSGAADEAQYTFGREVGCSVCRHSPAWSIPSTSTVTTTTGTDTLNQQFDRDLSAVAADSEIHTNRTADDLLRAIVDSKALVDSDASRLKADFNAAIGALRDEFIAFSTDPILVPEASGCGGTESCPGKATITGDDDGDLTMRGDTLSFESKECGLTDLCKLKQQVTAMFKRFKPDTTTTAATTPAQPADGVNGTGSGSSNATNCALNPFGPGC